MKKLNILLLIIVFMFSITSCSKQPETQDENIEIAKTAILESYSAKFVIIPEECINFISYDSEKDVYMFKVTYNPVEFYSELYDEDYVANEIDETIWVKEDNQCYSVYINSNSLVYTYYDTTT